MGTELSTVGMTITEEERQLILKHRAEKASYEEKHPLRIKVLDLTRRYDEWLYKNGCGDTFSTFVDEFGYDAHDASAMHRCVRILREKLP